MTTPPHAPDFGRSDPPLKHSPSSADPFVGAALPASGLRGFVNPLAHADEANGIWIAPQSHVDSLIAAVRRPEFQIACLGPAETLRSPCAERVHLAQRIAQQNLLRVQWFSSEVEIGPPIPARLRGAIRSAVGVSPALAEEIGASITGWLATFTRISPCAAVALSVISERGPRRLELEGGGAPTAFHVDTAGLRLVAPLLGPQTIFILSDPGAGPLPAPKPHLQTTRSVYPFDFERAVRESYQQLVSVSQPGGAASILRAPDRYAILFPGSLATAERPLVHAGPQPQSAAEAIDWARLLITIDPL